MAATDSLTQTASWKALEAHYEQIKDVHLRNLFADDPNPRRADGRRRRRSHPRLFQESHHGETVRLLLQLAA